MILLDKIQRRLLIAHARRARRFSTTGTDAPDGIDATALPRKNTEGCRDVFAGDAIIPSGGVGVTSSPGQLVDTRRSLGVELPRTYYANWETLLMRYLQYLLAYTATHRISFPAQFRRRRSQMAVEEAYAVIVRRRRQFNI